MAMLGRGLAAQQHGRPVEEAAVERRLDHALGHEGEEALFVRLPAASALFVVVEELPGRGEQRLMPVVGAAELAQEERQVFALGEGGELRGVVEAHVDEALDARAPQGSEEVGRRSLRKTDRIDLHGGASSGPKSDSCAAAGRAAASASCSSASVWSLP